MLIKWWWSFITCFLCFALCSVTLTSLEVALLLWLEGSGATITWVFSRVGEFPLGRLCWGARVGAGRGLYFDGSGSAESESLGKVRERMLQGRSSVSNLTFPCCPTLSISNKATKPFGLCPKPGLAETLGFVLVGDGLFPRDAEPCWDTSGGDTEGGGWDWGWLCRMLRSSSLSSKVLSSSLSKGSSSRSKSAKLRLCDSGLLGWVFLGPRLGAGSGVRMALWLSPARTGFSAGGGTSWSSATDREFNPPPQLPPSMSWESLLSPSCFAAASSALAAAAWASASSIPQRTCRRSNEKLYCSEQGGRKEFGQKETILILSLVIITW